MKQRVIIVGAGLAGATAAVLLKDKFDVIVYEKAEDIGGLLFDKDGIQWFGPHAFHTDSKDVWDFITTYMPFQPYDLHVYVLSEPDAIQELPRRPEDDNVFSVYSEKAWGKPFHDLPEDIRQRVPQSCTDGRKGYHAGKYKGQPIQGYYNLIAAMFEGITVHCGKKIERSDIDCPVFWTGDINDYIQMCNEEYTSLQWIGREWDVHRGSLPYAVVNYATHAILPLRSFDCQKVNPYFPASVVISEYRSDKIPCYPSPEKQFRESAKTIVEQAKKKNHWLCGRMGTYQYLDMDKTILNVFATVQEFLKSA